MPCAPYWHLTVIVICFKIPRSLFHPYVTYLCYCTSCSRFMSCIPSYPYPCIACHMQISQSFISGLSYNSVCNCDEKRLFCPSFSTMSAYDIREALRVRLAGYFRGPTEKKKFPVTVSRLWCKRAVRDSNVRLLRALRTHTIIFHLQLA